MASLNRYDGVLITDHRASPGLNGRYPGEKLVEERTLWCHHCGTPQLANPDRSRPREYCRYCDAYICDGCASVAAKPDYKHRSFSELKDMISSGHWIIAGGSMREPILIPKEV